MIVSFPPGPRPSLRVGSGNETRFVIASTHETGNDRHVPGRRCVPIMMAYTMIVTTHAAINRSLISIKRG